MSAPTSAAPLVVNTRDGMCWTRREGTRGGEALYAPEKCGGCPDFVMATLTELAAHGIAGSADVLPVPVGPEPQALRSIAYAAKNTDLLLADAAERRRAAEWPWDMWCRICHIRPTSHRTEAEALEAADRHVKLVHAPQAEVHQLMTAGGLAELERLRARVAELKAKRADEHDELALALGRSNGTEWADLIEFAAGAVSVEAKWERRRVELTALRNDALNMRGVLSPNGEARKVPMPLGEVLAPAVEWLVGRVAELEARAGDPAMVCRECNAPVMWVDGADGGWWNHTGPAEDGHGIVPKPLLRASVERPVNGLTRTYSPVASLREDVYESPLHHDYRVGHDLPETGSTK